MSDVRKEYTCTLNGQDRTFRYTRKERQELEARFGMGLLELIQERVIPTKIDHEGKPKPTGGGQIAAQVALVHAGLKHHGSRVTEDNVGQWMDALSNNGGNIFEVLNSASLAVLTSGVLGFRYEPETEEEDPKAEAAPSPPSRGTSIEPVTG